MGIAATVLLGIVLVGRVFFSSSIQNVVASTGPGETKEITLPDGTIINLNENTALTYPENFTADSRDVFLQGEAFFDVERDESKPFVITTSDLEVRVLGTSFLVKEQEGLTSTEVQVSTGKVQVTSLEQPNQKVTLVKDEAASFASLDKKMTKLEANPNDLFWQNKTLIFNQTELEQVMEVIELTYNTQIDFKNDKLKTCKLSAKFQDQNLEGIFTIISTSLSVNFEQSENIWYVSGESCE